MEPNQLSPTPERPKNRIIIIVAAIAIAVIAVGAIVATNLGNRQPVTNQNSAETLFDDMLTTTAVKSKVQLSYAQHDFDSKSDLEAQKSSRQHYSVGELDAATKQYRTVFASQLSSGDLAYYLVQRCLDGKAYRPDAFAQQIKTIDDVKNILKQPFIEVPASNSADAEDCDANNPDHLGRATDGVIPVGLTEQQAKSWVTNLKDAKFLQVRDGGTTTYNQKLVRKINLTTASLAGSGNFFQAVQAGAGVQLTTKDGKVGPDAYRLEAMATSDNIEGFYLVDEATKLPVYSEFTSIGLLNDNKKGSVIKQAYSYPDSLGLNLSSTINILE